jgi:hypothetical protein
MTTINLETLPLSTPNNGAAPVVVLPAVAPVV